MIGKLRFIDKLTTPHWIQRTKYLSLIILSSNLTWLCGPIHWICLQISLSLDIRQMQTWVLYHVLSYLLLLVNYLIDQKFLLNISSTNRRPYSFTQVRSLIIQCNTMVPRLNLPIHLRTLPRLLKVINTELKVLLAFIIVLL